MTLSSQPISANILDFDDDFERTLRKKKKNLELHPSSSSSASNLEKEEEPTAREEEEVQTMTADNRTIKELFASGMDNAAPLCIQYPRAAQDKTDEFELKSRSQQAFERVRGGMFKHDSNQR
ncbi:S ribonuclease [Pyrus ussuriensis x Pyrus communis]|uniref:S ribonuclease n=1 Tax=Pyrus ussuriensis x Pyrus communis TaxID=2448454 RepID=A0A5N5ID77_9ROSA|nr:S ribonuclease [Pyrus ussuriensis x Pyrus communis]